MIDNSLKQSEKRLIAFDMLKLFAIYLVLVGHSVQYLLPTNPYNEPLYLYIYSFHMPLFMAIAGYFSYKEQLSIGAAWGGGVKKRFMQLIVPSFFWMVIHALIKISITFQEINSILLLKEEFFEVLWFLKSLFICYVLYVLMSSVKSLIIRHLLFAFVIAFMAFVSCFHLSLMFPSFLFGVYLKKKDVLAKPNMLKFLLLSSICVFLVCLSFWDASCYNNPPHIISSAFVLDFSPLITFVGIYMYRLLVGLSGALFFISLFSVVFKSDYTASRHSLIGFLAKQGRYTQAVYILQVIILETILAHYISFEDVNNIFFVNIILIPFFSMVILAFCLLLTSFLMKYPISAFLLGNTWKK